MSVPDYFFVVNEVYASGSYDLRTKEGCGEFTEDVASALHVRDRRFGHLRKRPGQNQYNGHAVDAVLYLADQPGQSQAVDLIFSSESPAARPNWSVDIPRYSASDWEAPSDVVTPPAPPQPPAIDPIAKAIAQIDEMHGWVREIVTFVRRFQ